MHPDTGAIASDRRQWDQIWLLHFGRQEQGEVLPVSESADTMIASSGPTRSCQATRTSPRSSGPSHEVRQQDLTASQLMHSAPHPQNGSKILFPLLQQRQPAQWRSGVLFEAFKRSGLQSAVANYRSLFNSNNMAKVYHRVVRNKAQQFGRDEFHGLHLGSKKQAPVTYASMFVLTHFRRCLHTNAAHLCCTWTQHLRITVSYES